MAKTLFGRGRHCALRLEDVRYHLRKQTRILRLSYIESDRDDDLESKTLKAWPTAEKLLHTNIVHVAPEDVLSLLDPLEGYHWCRPKFDIVYNVSLSVELGRWFP